MKIQGNTIRGLFAGMLAGFTLFHVAANALVQPVLDRITIEEVVRPMPIEGIVKVQPVITELPKPTRYFVAPLKVTKAEAYCLAKNIYHEAGIDSDAGKIAVGQVTIQRMQAKRWKSDTTICKVVYRSHAFSWTLEADKRKEQPKGKLWEASKRAAQAVIDGERIPGLEGALFYHAEYVDQKKVAWAAPEYLLTQVDTHLFYKNDRKIQ